MKEDGVHRRDDRKEIPAMKLVGCFMDLKNQIVEFRDAKCWLSLTHGKKENFSGNEVEVLAVRISETLKNNPGSFTMLLNHSRSTEPLSNNWLPQIEKLCWTSLRVK
ncbi:unnamed protein product [Albugo candida]|uniref:Uncharacterized protein n=1 Tax=Albugo candida TaxID=65357 RepID=A0A024FVY4_9STRA|nr:unnamed protein product [Albugo candida]|eukprot:CCI11290.1 unnamed protein product [Albugo candida]